MTNATVLAREGALLEFCVRRGDIALLQPLVVQGRPLAGCKVSKGVLLGQDGARLGQVKFEGDGMSLVGTDGRVIEKLDRWGCGKSGPLLEHPVHRGGAWASLLAKNGVKVAAVAARPVAAAAREEEEPAVPAPAKGRGWMVAAGVAVAAAVGAVVLFGGGETPKVEVAKADKQGPRAAEEVPAAGAKDASPAQGAAEKPGRVAANPEAAGATAPAIGDVAAPVGVVGAAAVAAREAAPAKGDVAAPAVAGEGTKAGRAVAPVAGAAAAAPAVGGRAALKQADKTGNPVAAAVTAPTAKPAPAQPVTPPALEPSRAAEKLRAERAPQPMPATGQTSRPATAARPAAGGVERVATATGGGMGRSRAVKMGPLSPPSFPRKGEPLGQGTHAVETGDCLYYLALRAGMEDIRSIAGWIEFTMRENQLTDPNLVVTGQTLKIPLAGTVPEWKGDLLTP